MNPIDLELYRWRIVQMMDHSSAHKNFKDALLWRVYWQEYGAFVSTMPRRSGKTTMLKKMADYFKKKAEDYLILVPQSNRTTFMVQMGFDIHKICSRIIVSKNEVSNINLLVDDYQEFIISNELKTALTYGWKSVSLVGTLNVK